MSSAEKRRPARGNHLLSLLSDDAYVALLPFLEPVQFSTKQMVHERSKPFADVYFHDLGYSALDGWGRRRSRDGGQ